MMAPTMPHGSSPAGNPSGQAPSGQAEDGHTALLEDWAVLPHSGAAQEDGVDLLALLAAFITQWRLILVTSAIVFFISLGYIFRLKSQFVATATVLPAVEHNANDPLAALFSPRTSGGVFVGLLQSKTVSNDVIDRAHLLDVYHTKSYEQARAILAGQASFGVGLDTILAITVKDTNAARAQQIANDYLSALNDLNVSMSESQSRELQNFFQQQLQREKSDLYQAESQMEKTQQKTGLIQPETQTQIGLNAIAQVRAQILALQVQLSSLSQSETDANPQVRALETQIAKLQAQEAQMENGGHSPVGAAPSAGQMPSNSLDYVRSARDVKYYEGLVSSLSSQFENARLSEDLSRPVFQIIDQAALPEKKSWPPRKLFLIIALVLAIFVGLIAAAARLFWFRIMTNPANASSLQRIRAAFGGR